MSEIRIGLFLSPVGENMYALGLAFDSNKLAS